IPDLLVPSRLYLSPSSRLLLSTTPRLSSPYRCPYPPYLPSFPTRRSSDLARWDGPPGPAAPPRSTDATTRPPPVAVTRRGSWPRSEEHTSELQSRFDLVCRLLLEKKKTRAALPSLANVRTSVRYTALCT